MLSACTMKDKLSDQMRTVITALNDDAPEAILDTLYPGLISEAEFRDGMRKPWGFGKKPTSMTSGWFEPSIA